MFRWTLGAAFPPTRQTGRVSEHLDVIVVGAGLSGVGAGYRLQTRCPAKSYAILEARGAMGGTWDLFRYPGIRSDSDMATLGFPFEPWTDRDAIAGGDKILAYLKRTAAKYGIDRRIRLDHQVVSAQWSSEQARWTLTVRCGGEVKTLTCAFLYLCSGYYDYEHGHRPHFSGEDDFTGDLVHPQFWPEGLETAGKKVVVIGSGATAMTLVPALAQGGAHVTMVQRTPTWVTVLPRRDRVADLLHRALPARTAGAVVRAKNVLVGSAFYQVTRRRPALARRILGQGVRRGLADMEHAEEVQREHFTPTYDPWDQRLCVVPDADLFEVLRDGRAAVVTEAVDTFTRSGVRLASGRELPADVIVTATGLQMLVAGGIDIVVDGERRASHDLFVYRGLMLGGVPNLALAIGYVNASWTLRADLASRYLCRLLNHLDANGLRVAVPVPPADLSPRPLLPLASGYVQRAADRLPAQGDRSPWLMRQNYLLDRSEMIRGDLTEGMVFTP